MTTLEEAIKYCEEVVDLCEFEASEYDITDIYESHVACQEGEWDECAVKYRQFAEWLRKYQKIKEIYDNWNIDFGVGDYRAMNKIGEVLNGDATDTNVGSMKIQLSAESTTNLQPTCKQLATDTISRQVAIEALKKISFLHLFEFGEEYPSEDTKEEIEIINSNKAFEAIKALPPVQSEPSIPISWIEKQIN